MLHEKQQAISSGVLYLFEPFGAHGGVSASAIRPQMHNVVGLEIVSPQSSQQTAGYCWRTLSRNIKELYAHINRLKALFEDGGPRHVAAGLPRPRIQSIVSLMKARRLETGGKENR